MQNTFRLLSEPYFSVLSFRSESTTGIDSLVSFLVIVPTYCNDSVIVKKR